MGLQGRSWWKEERKRGGEEGRKGRKERERENEGRTGEREMLMMQMASRMRDKIRMSWIEWMDKV